MEAGYQRILIGLGDSGTNDAGAGLAKCLGIRCLDQAGEELPSGGKNLINLRSVDTNGIHPALASCTLTALYDVTNPLCGTGGASFTYGPQKGATPEQAQLLDSALENFASVIETSYGRDIRNLQGSGAAGGLGGGLVAFFGALLRPGFEVISGILELEKAFEKADVVLTGEGQVDSQSAAGKTVGGISSLAKRCGVPSVIAITGRNLLNRNEATAIGIDAIFPLFEHSNKNTNAYMNTTRSIEETTIRSLQEFPLR
jgi:glycerate kinase